MVLSRDIKGAVSYQFTQGLLILMCNNSKLKADINFFSVVKTNIQSLQLVAKIYDSIPGGFVIAFGAKLPFS